MEGLKIAMDVANGATYKVAPAAFTELGADVTVIHNEPNGLNINDDCGSQHTEDLRRTVRETGAAIGLAFDGDGDRLIAVDEKGTEITGDQILLICARMLQAEGRLNKDLLVSTVMSNLGLRVAAQRYGFATTPPRWATGTCSKTCSAWAPCSAARTRGTSSSSSTTPPATASSPPCSWWPPCSRRASRCPSWRRSWTSFRRGSSTSGWRASPICRRCPRSCEAIAAAEAALGDQGRVLVRYSGTESLCRVMVEGPTAEVTDKWAEEIAEVVRSRPGARRPDVGATGRPHAVHTIRSLQRRRDAICWAL